MHDYYDYLRRNQDPYLSTINELLRDAENLVLPGFGFEKAVTFEEVIRCFEKNKEEIDKIIERIRGIIQHQREVDSVLTGRF
jgi:hypothetical protein